MKNKLFLLTHSKFSLFTPFLIHFKMHNCFCFCSYLFLLQLSVSHKQCNRKCITSSLLPYFAILCLSHSTHIKIQPRINRNTFNLFKHGCRFVKGYLSSSGTPPFFRAQLFFSYHILKLAIFSQWCVTNILSSSCLPKGCLKNS